MGETRPLAAPGRYHDLDALRAAAMLLGIVWHAALGFAAGGGATDWPTDSKSVEFAFDSLIYVLHAFRLEVFFLMAGFFAALVVGRRGARPFTRQRLERIGIPLAVGVITVVPLTHIANAWLGSERTGTPFEMPTSEILSPEPLHLWFLWYLLLFYAAALVVRRFAPQRLAEHSLTGFAWLVRSRLRLPLLVGLAAILLIPQPGWTVETPWEWLPQPDAFAYYGMYFGFGWLLYLRRDLLEEVGRRPWSHLAVAAVAGVVVMAMIEARGQTGGAYGAVGMTLTAIVGWSATFGLVGLAARLFASDRPWVRYVADSSYWLFVAHLPLVAALHALLLPAKLPMPIVLVVVLAVAVPILLVTYELFVRHTIIGRTMNGPRPARGAGRAVPEAGSA